MNFIKSVFFAMLFVSLPAIATADGVLEDPPHQSTISEEQAKNIAFTHAKVNARDIDHIIVTLNNKGREPEYDVEFWVGNQEDDYGINAITGKIVSYDYDAEGNYPGMRQSQSQPQSQPQSQTRDNRNYISESQAIATALKHAGIRESEANQLRCQLDSSGRFAEYEIEWRVGRTKYEYTIDATTGNISEFDVDKG